MLTARELNDPASARIRALPGAVPRAPRPPTPSARTGRPGSGCSAIAHGADGDPRNAMAIVTEGDYGTVCSSLVALPAAGPPRMWFARGLPGEAPFEAIAG